MKLNTFSNLKKAFLWCKHRLEHKVQHFSAIELKKLLTKGGISLLVIAVAWEIIEDVLFPTIFWTLGKFVHPIFYAGMPISWMLCLHWIAVPVLWGIWMKISKRFD
jgi:hypothetical protein